MHLKFSEGSEVHWYEATGGYGGRASTIEDGKSGETIDNGQHLLSGAYDDFLELIEILGSQKYIHRPEALIVPYIKSNKKGTARAVLDTSKGWGKVGTLRGLMSFGLFNLKDKLSIIRLAVRINLGITRALDGESCDAFLRRQKQTEAAIDIFWEPLILATLNTPVRIASAVLLKRVCELAFFASKDRSALLFPKGDFSVILEPAISRYQEVGGEKRTGKVKSIELTGAGVMLGFSDREDEEYDYVVSCLPALQARKLLKLPELEHYEPSPITSIYIWTDREIIQEDFCALIGTRMEWVFNRTKIQGIKHKISRYSFSFTVSAASDLVRKKADEIIDILIEDLNKICDGGFQKNEILHHRVIHEAMATFSASTDFEKSREGVPSVIGDRIFIAGDWTNTGLPGTLESAARSGKKAALELNKRLT